MSIFVKDLKKSYGDHLVIDLPYLTLPIGITCLGGPSGCGKTTLARLLSGLEAPDGGQIEGRIGHPTVLFQETRLLPALSAHHNVACVSKDRDALTTAADLLRALGFEKEDLRKKPSALSGGMRQRVAIARALLFAKERGGNLVILDEPFRGLDPERKVQTAVLLQTMLQDKAVLVITHEAEEAALLGGTYLDFPSLNRKT